jgi:hypothetical protein
MKEEEIKDETIQYTGTNYLIAKIEVANFS